MADPQTDLPNQASPKPTWSFHERYSSDPEFKRQVDYGRQQRAQEQSTAALTDSLNMVNKRQKLY